MLQPWSDRSKNRDLMLKILILISVFFTSCTSFTKADLARRDDYLPSMYYFSQGDVHASKNAFPVKENQGFITSVEKGWLGFLAGHSDPDALRRVSDDLESKKTFKIRKEAQSYFYKESTDTYFPAEHEVIVTHLALGFSYLQKNDYTAAAVEAKKAAFYLQSGFNQDGNFDYAGLRILLATLWAACGKWESAQVDLRVVGKMSPELMWAKKISQSVKPPKKNISCGALWGGPRYHLGSKGAEI